MAPIRAACLICHEAKDKTRKCKPDQFIKIEKSIKIRKHFDLIYGDVTLPEEYNDTIFYHSRCYNNVSAINKRYIEAYEKYDQDKKIENEQKTQEQEARDDENVLMKDVESCDDQLERTVAMETNEDFGRIYPALPTSSAEMDVDDDSILNPQATSSMHNGDEAGILSHDVSKSDDVEMVDLVPVESISNAAVADDTENADVTNNTNASPSNNPIIDISVGQNEENNTPASLPEPSGW